MMNLGILSRMIWTYNCANIENLLSTISMLGQTGKYRQQRDGASWRFGWKKRARSSVKRIWLHEFSNGVDFATTSMEEKITLFESGNFEIMKFQNSVHQRLCHFPRRKYQFSTQRRNLFERNRSSWKGKFKRKSEKRNVKSASRITRLRSQTGVLLTPPIV